MKRLVVFFIGVFIVVILFCIIANGIHQKNILFLAIENNDIKQARRAIDRGAFVNFRENCFAPSFLASVYDCNPTPLVLACQFGNEEMVKLLVESGAKVNRRDNMTQITPIEMALHYKTTNRFQIAAYLIHEGADVYECDISGIFTDILVVYNSDGVATIDDGFEFLKYLLEDCNLMPSLERGTENALTFAAKHNNLNAVRYFIENQYYSIDSLDKSQNTALLAVVKYEENLDMVKLLCGMGADIETTDAEGKTAYDYALEKGYVRIVEFLEQIQST